MFELSFFSCILIHENRKFQKISKTTATENALTEKLLIDALSVFLFLFLSFYNICVLFVSHIFCCRLFPGKPRDMK